MHPVLKLLWSQWLNPLDPPAVYLCLKSQMWGFFFLLLLFLSPDRQSIRALVSLAMFYSWHLVSSLTCTGTGWLCCVLTPGWSSVITSVSSCSCLASEKIQTTMFNHRKCFPLNSYYSSQLPKVTVWPVMIQVMEQPLEVSIQLTVQTCRVRIGLLLCRSSWLDSSLPKTVFWLLQLLSGSQMFTSSMMNKTRLRWRGLLVHEVHIKTSSQW